ncbi:hypothetical protein N7491_007849 [Penicillium cf. griseofulvum]|nr:hypothetical protein N7491_007849 [Penicillium cf. griseofulvum]
MDFCIELLNQRIGVSEYESAFVCALAVLGRTSYGWMDTDSYPPILSKILKIARFIVLYKAVRLDPYVDELIASFRGYSSKLVLSAETPFDEPGYLLSGEDRILYKDLHFTIRDFQTAHRNIFIEDRLVVIATSYHKGFYTRNDTKLIHRYLPREVGKLLVLTLEQTPTRTAEVYIWAPDPSTGRVWSSGRFREALRNKSAIGLHGHTLNISSYRDIAIGISRRFLRTASAFPQNSYEEGDTEKEIKDGDNIDLEGSTGFNSILSHIADL